LFLLCFCFCFCLAFACYNAHTTFTTILLSRLSFSIVTLQGLSVTSTESSNGDSATTTATATLIVTAVADAPTISGAGGAGNEDEGPFAFPITAALVDDNGSETLSAITVTGLPTGFALSAGTNGVVDATDWAALTVSTPLHWSGKLQLTLSATSAESSNGDAATSTATATLTVTPVADAPTISEVVPAASCLEDASLCPVASPLCSLVDADGSETLALSFAGVPTGFNNVELVDGTLSFSAPANWNGRFTVAWTCAATESEGALANGDTATSSGETAFHVVAVNDRPSITVGTAFVYSPSHVWGTTSAGFLAGLSLADIDDPANRRTRALTVDCAAPALCAASACDSASVGMSNQITMTGSLAALATCLDSVTFSTLQATPTFTLPVIVTVDDQLNGDDPLLSPPSTNNLVSLAIEVALQCPNFFGRQCTYILFVCEPFRVDSLHANIHFYVQFKHKTHSHTRAHSHTL
jgi:hypothetical protein